MDGKRGQKSRNSKLLPERLIEFTPFLYKRSATYINNINISLYIGIIIFLEHVNFTQDCKFCSSHLFLRTRLRTSGEKARTHGKTKTGGVSRVIHSARVHSHTIPFRAGNEWGEFYTLDIHYYHARKKKKGTNHLHPIRP
jgi:hypothetical protein